MERLKHIKTFVLDMDGTIYLGNRLFPFTQDFLKAVESSGRSFYFFTNNSSKNREAYLKKLAGMNISIKKEQMLIANHVIIEWLKNETNCKNAYIVGTPDLVADFAMNGIPFEESRPDAVILGFDTTLTYEKISKACTHIRNGVPVFGVNPDWNCPTEDGFIPDCGAIAALVKASTGVQCEFFGKPSPKTLAYILKATGSRPEDLAIVGDRLYTDIATAKNSAVTSILVLSGETKSEDIEKSDISPDIVCQDIAEITAYLENI